MSALGLRVMISLVFGVTGVRGRRAAADRDAGRGLRVDRRRGDRASPGRLAGQSPGRPRLPGRRVPGGGALRREAGRAGARVRAERSRLHRHRAPTDAIHRTALARFAATHGIRFPLLRDIGGAVAAQLGARRTPEVVVLDDRRQIRYRGRIDDQYAVGSRRAEPRSHDLRDALEDLLAGRPVSRPETEAVGCPIDPPAAPAIAGRGDL